MGTFKKEKQRRVREGNVKDGNLRVKGENFYRDSKRVQFLNMYKGGRSVRNAKGDIIKAAPLQDTAAPTARVAPDRRWFGNTRVISQDSLSHFREALGDNKKDSYQFLLRRNKLPMSLLDEKDTTESPTARILETEPFDKTFGPKAQRKKPRVAASSLEDLISSTENDNKTYEEKLELDSTLGLMGKQEEEDGWTQMTKEAIFHKGQSKRIWNELYKVIDSSDVVIHVLDARDPLGTRCKSVEEYMTKETPHKHLIYVLNKCDLVPTWVAVCFNTVFFFIFLLTFRVFHPSVDDVREKSLMPFCSVKVDSMTYRHIYIANKCTKTLCQGVSSYTTMYTFHLRKCLLQFWKNNTTRSQSFHRFDGALIE